MVPRPEDLAATLVRRAHRRRKDDERRLARARAGVEAVLQTCLEAGSLRRAWLIGSGAWGGAHARSDLDIVVEGLPGPEGGRGVGLTAGALWDRLSQAAGLDVDLLRFEELDRGFQRRVLAEGVEIHGT